MSTCNWLDVETLGSWPIMLKNVLGHIDEFFVFFFFFFLLQNSPLWHAPSNVYLFRYSLRWFFCSYYFRLHVLSKTRLELVKTYFPSCWLLSHPNLSSLDWFGVSNLNLHANLVYIVYIGLYNNNQRFSSSPHLVRPPPQQVLWTLTPQRQLSHWAIMVNAMLNFQENSLERGKICRCMKITLIYVENM